MGATIVNRVEDIRESDVGTECGLFKVEKIGDECVPFLLSLFPSFPLRLSALLLLLALSLELGQSPLPTQSITQPEFKADVDRLPP